MESKGELIACHVYLEVFGILRDHSMCGGKQSLKSQLTGAQSGHGHCWKSIGSLFGRRILSSPDRPAWQALNTRSSAEFSDCFPRSDQLCTGGTGQILDETCLVARYDLLDAPQ